MIKIKIITTILAIALLPLKSLAIDSNFKNSLNEIYIKKSSGNNYSVNFLFNKEYTEPLSLQKKSETTYSIILPETKLSSKNIKVIYKDGQEDIKLTVDEHPYLDKTINNGYVKVIASVKNNIKLNVSTDVISNSTSKPAISKVKEIKQAQKPIPPIQTEKQAPKQEAETSTPPETEVSPGQEDLEIMSGIASVEQVLEKKDKPEEKTDLNKDYLSIMIKISLFLFLMLIIIRQIYKKLKIRAARIQEREELKQNYRKRLEGVAEELEDEGHLEKLYPDTNQKSSFQRQVEAMSQQTAQTVSSKQPVKQQPQPNKHPQQPIIIEDEHLDENFDYEIIEDPNDSDETYTPKLLSEAKIDNNKGFYLIQYDGEVSLVGYIKDEYIVINKFNKIFKPNLQTRLHERKDGCANYLIRVDGYKALIQVSDNYMKVLIEF